MLRKKTVMKKAMVRGAKATKQTAVMPGRGTEVRRVVLDVPFAMRGVATTNAAKWDADLGVFVFAGEVLPAALEPFLPLPYSFEQSVQATLDAEAGRVPPPVAAHEAPRDKMVPRPHQKDAAAAILDVAALIAIHLHGSVSVG